MQIYTRFSFDNDREPHLITQVSTYADGDSNSSMLELSANQTDDEINHVVETLESHGFTVTKLKHHIPYIEEAYCNESTDTEENPELLLKAEEALRTATARNNVRDRIQALKITASGNNDATATHDNLLQVLKNNNLASKHESVQHTMQLTDQVINSLLNNPITRYLGEHPRKITGMASSLSNICLTASGISLDSSGVSIHDGFTFATGLSAILVSGLLSIYGSGGNKNIPVEQALEIIDTALKPIVNATSEEEKNREVIKLIERFPDVEKNRFKEFLADPHGFMRENVTAMWVTNFITKPLFLALDGLAHPFTKPALLTNFGVVLARIPSVIGHSRPDLEFNPKVDDVSKHLLRNRDAYFAWSALYTQLTLAITAAQTHNPLLGAASILATIGALAMFKAKTSTNSSSFQSLLESTTETLAGVFGDMAYDAAKPIALMLAEQKAIKPSEARAFELALKSNLSQQSVAISR